MSAFDLELVQLKKVYPGGTLAVEGFDLQVEKGEFISFVGPSGCGKTTTLRMIAGLEDITSGDLLIRGRNFTNIPAEERPTATIFQNYAIFPHMSVRENIAFGLEVRGLSSADVKRRVDAIIDKLELGDVAGARERNLSGGQKQRVALARGLVTEPDILLLDEPLGALDANLRKSIQEELKILQRELGLTFVFVTHAQSEALAMGDRVVVMNNGRVEQISPPFELYTRPRTSFVARFIGRNMIFGGETVEAASGKAVVKTQVGVLSGVAEQSLAVGAAASVVTPSEYVSLAREGAPVDPEATNHVPGVVEVIDVVGRIAFVTVRVGDALSVRIETHKDGLSEAGVESGGAVDLSWRPERATVVPGDG